VQSHVDTQHIYADAMVGMGGDRTPIMNKASAT